MKSSFSLIRPALRRAFSALCALSVLSSACFFASAGTKSVNAGKNLSLFGVAVTNTEGSDWKLDSRGGFYEIGAVNDSDSSSVWQLGTAAESGEWTAAEFYGYTPYAGVIWDVPQDGINRIYVRIDSDLGGLAELSVEYSEDGAAWKNAAFSEITPAETEGDRDLRIMPLYSVKGLRVNLISGTGSNAPAVREIETFAYAGEYSGPDLSLLQRAADYAGRSFAESNIYGYNSDAWSRLKNAMIAAAVADMECKSGGRAAGYSQDGIDAVTSELLNAVGGVTGDTAGDTGCNKLQNCVAVCDYLNLSPLNREYTARSVTDGVLFEGGWEPSIPAGAEIYIKLRKAETVDRLMLYVSKPESGFRVEYTTDAAEDANTHGGLSALHWSPMCSSDFPTSKYTLARDTVRYSFDLEKHTGVTAVRLVCTPDENSGFCLREIEAYSASNEPISKKTVQLRNTEERIRIYAASVDKRLAEGRIVLCEFTVTRDGESRSATAQAEIAAAQMLFGGENAVRITPEEFSAGGDYVFYIMFRNIRETDELTLSFSLTDP